jgi:hypothetical protein
MSKGYMTLEVELSGEGEFVELSGNNAKYWPTFGLPTYEGSIDGLPESVLAQLQQRNLIKQIA